MLSLTVALDSGTVYVGGLRKTDDQEVSLRNGDVIPASIEFRQTVSSQSTVDMGSSAGVRLSIKPKGQYDANALLAFASWTRTVTDGAISYRTTLNTASGGIDRLLGVDPYDSCESVAIQTTATSVVGSYFDLSDSVGVVRVWLGLAATASIPSPDAGRLLKVVILGTENASDIAAKIAAALDADLEFSATSAGSLVTATCSFSGQRIPPHPRSSGYGISVLVAGGDETVTDVPSVVLQAEIAWAYDGNLTTSKGLKWRVENTNRRASQPISLPYFDTSNIASSVVLFTTQSLSSAQQEQARANIGAGAVIGGTPVNGKLVGVLSSATVYATLSELGVAVDGGQV